jgi:hypothetical protein
MDFFKTYGFNFQDPLVADDLNQQTGSAHAGESKSDDAYHRILFVGIESFCGLFPCVTEFLYAPEKLFFACSQVSEELE